MKAKDFFDEVGDPADWLVGLMPCQKPDGSEIFQEREMEAFLKFVEVTSQQMSIVIGANITRRNRLYADVREGLGIKKLVSKSNSEQMFYSMAHRYGFSMH